VAVAGVLIEKLERFQMAERTLEINGKKTRKNRQVPKLRSKRRPLAVVSNSSDRTQFKLQKREGNWISPRQLCQSLMLVYRIFITNTHIKHFPENIKREKAGTLTDNANRNYI
jgi:ribosomal protein L16/L10AE